MSMTSKTVRRALESVQMDALKEREGGGGGGENGEKGEREREREKRGS